MKLKILVVIKKSKNLKMIKRLKQLKLLCKFSNISVSRLQKNKDSQRKLGKCKHDKRITPYMNS